MSPRISFLATPGHPELRNSEILNVFAYTCGFSVCAARAGARTTSLDLSKKYLEWGRRNFALNGLDPAAHDFIYGDAFDWLRRLAKKGRAFDAVVLDPPTFSQSKEHGTFRAEKDYGKLVTAALPVRQAGRNFVCLDECGGLAAGGISRGRGNGGSRREAENFAAALRPATAGFPHQPRRTGVFENGMVEDRVAFGPASAFKSPAANIFYSTPYPSSRNRWSL